jgi:ketosteroid isomerase-like protein
MTQDESTLALAERFFRAIESGDLDGIRACYAPDAVIWHNNDRVDETREQNAATLTAFIGSSRSRRYVVSRRETFAGGFFQQHVLVAESRSGETVELPACVVCTVNHGVITRLDEYFDSLQVAALVQCMSAGLAPA